MRPQDRARQLRPYIEEAAASLPDADALEAVELFEQWAVGFFYPEGKRTRDYGVLYRCRQEHTSQADWRPSITPALWEVVPKPGQGDTPDNPIYFEHGMALEKDKYYSQFDVLYICTRDSGIPLHNDLAELVGHYVEVYEP